MTITFTDLFVPCTLLICNFAICDSYSKCSFEQINKYSIIFCCIFKATFGGETKEDPFRKI